MADDRQPDAPEEPEENRPAKQGPGFGGASSGRGDSSGRTGGDGRNQGEGGGGDEPAGNPFEALLSQFGLDPSALNAAGMGGGDLAAMMAQLQNAFASMAQSGQGAGLFGRGAAADSGSGVNWEVTKDTARKTVASLGSDPSPSMSQQQSLTQAVSIAETWLDAATDFPRVSATVSAWSRAQWIEQTMPVWRRLVEPVASHIAGAMEGALQLGGEEGQSLPGMAGMEQMLRPMLRTSGASMFGLQLGQGVGRLAAEVVGATDIGLPLSEPGHVALLPTNVAAFGAGLEQSETDVTLYLALREAARQRLFAAVPWLREQMLTLVEEYARGITIDTSALEEAVSGLDPSNLQDFGAKLEGGLFEPQKTPAQQATLARLETMLALVEGWVDEVVTQATKEWMPAAAALGEVVRRARATGGPAEATFATLVGLELRPRRMRDATTLWAALRDARGAEGRDAVWTHPDLIPTSADLDDPLGFVSGDRTSATDDEFDAALQELLDTEAGTSTDPEGGPGKTTDEPEDPKAG